MFLAVVHLADIFDVLIVEQRFDLRLEICLVGGIDLGGQLQVDFARFCEPDRLVGALLLRKSAKVEKIVLRFRIELEQAFRIAVIDRARPVDAGHRRSLRIADRNPGHSAVAFQNIDIIGHIEPSVHGEDGWRPGARGEGQGEVFEMRMDYVELSGHLLVHLREHQHVCDDGRVNFPPEPKALRYRRDQPGAGDGVSGGEKCHLVASLHQPLGEIIDDALCSAIFLWRNAFDQRGDLRDFQFLHRVTFYFIAPLKIVMIPTLSGKSDGAQKPEFRKLSGRGFRAPPNAAIGARNKFLAVRFIWPDSNP